MVTARVLFLLAALAGTVFSNDLLSGYRIEGLHYAGPGEWRHTADPIWVFDITPSASAIALPVSRRRTVLC